MENNHFVSAALLTVVSVVVVGYVLAAFYSAVQAGVSAALKLLGGA